MRLFADKLFTCVVYLEVCLQAVYGGFGVSFHVPKGRGSVSRGLEVHAILVDCARKGSLIVVEIGVEIAI